MTPGAHNLIFMGPLGAGQTLLARAPPSILPRLNLRHPLSVTDIRAVTFTVHG